jgi:hypothetical protein
VRTGAPKWGGWCPGGVWKARAACATNCTCRSPFMIIKRTHQGSFACQNAEMGYTCLGCGGVLALLGAATQRVGPKTPLRGPRAHAILTDSSTSYHRPRFLMEANVSIHLKLSEHFPWTSRIAPPSHDVSLLENVGLAGTNAYHCNSPSCAGAILFSDIRKGGRAGRPGSRPTTHQGTHAPWAHPPPHPHPPPPHAPRPRFSIHPILLLLMCDLGVRGRLGSASAACVWWQGLVPVALFFVAR